MMDDWAQVLTSKVLHSRLHQETIRQLAGLAWRPDVKSASAIGLGMTMNFMAGIHGTEMVPSGYVKIAIENGPFIVDLPIENGDFP